MNEAELVRRIIDFSLIIKGQLNRKETELLRSILNIIIMEAEDVREEMQIDGASAVRKVGEIFCFSCLQRPARRKPVRAFFAFCFVKL